MAYETRAPRLRTGAARNSDHVGASIVPSNTIARPSVQDIAPAIIGQRFGLSPCIARLVCELAQIGGQA